MTTSETGRGMGWITSLVLLANVFFLAKDMKDDLGEGMGFDHIIPEIIVALASTGVLILLFSRLRKSRDESKQLRNDLGQLRIVAEAWRKKTALYSLGLAQAIDDQLDSWSLSSAEKEVSLLLLKGLSNKEIAEIRQTSEQTVKQQSSAIYRKSGLANRSELSAYFLEDLLSPPTHKDPTSVGSAVHSTFVE